MDNLPLALDDTIHAAVMQHCAAGDKLADEQHWNMALSEYAKA